jgi:hypothetical protein
MVQPHLINKQARKPNISQLPIYLDNPRIGKISYMLWLSQVFRNVNIVDMLEVSLLLDKYFKPQYLGVPEK